MKSETFQEQIDREQKMLAYQIHVMKMIDDMFNALEDDKKEEIEHDKE